MTGILLAACNLQGEQAPTPTHSPTATPTIMPSPTPLPAAYWVQPEVPTDLASAAKTALTAAGFIEAASADGAQIQLVLNPPADSPLAAQRVYALVVPFPTIADDMTLDALKALWQGAEGVPPGFDGVPRVFATPETMSALSASLGQPGANLVQADAASLVDAAWNARPSLAVVPFDQLEPRWKVLTLDGRSPLDRALDINAYPLVVRAGVIAAGDAGAKGVEAIWASGAWQITNRDPAMMSTLVLTGTTAMTRATGWFMDNRGVNFPAENILPFLADADILHVSNEVSFTPKCPPAQLNSDEVFCSSPAYFDLLKNIGVDVVELTGNHNLDYGAAPANYTLDAYDTAQMAYFGGGRNLDDAKLPRILTTPSGARIAFVGCNSAGPFTSWATAQEPGAAPCEDWAWIKAAIADLKASQKADVVVVTLQSRELPQYNPGDEQRADFEALAAAGADIVSGSQAHQPQGFSFASGKVIHFGVGNLFFDQMDHLENRQMFADKYILYGGRVISLVLFTGMNENWSQPRPMTPEERVEFLKTIFQASGW